MSASLVRAPVAARAASALPPTTTRPLLRLVAAAAKGDPNSKGFAAAATTATTPSSKAAKKKGTPPPAGAPKPRSNGRGALKRTEQGARLGVGSGSSSASTPKSNTPSGPGEWVRLAKLSEWREGKAGKAVTLPDGTVLCLFAVRPAGAPPTSTPRVYASEIYSSAFKYPLVDAEVEIASGKGGGSAIVTVPFDGTTYDLADGSVVAWCPRNTPVRALLGAVKSRVDPTPIRVYPAKVAGDGEGVEVWFAR